MYISIENSHKLDVIVKSFEVAYRSYIVDRLKKEFPTLNDFSKSVFALYDSIEHSSIVNASKTKSKLIKIKREVGKYYSIIDDCYLCYFNKDYHDNNVPYVSDLVDFVNFYYGNCFHDVSNGFITVEEFNDYSSKYHLIRNNLSHPASSKILVSRTKEVISFIKRILNNIDDDYFWYISKKEIKNKIDNFINSIEQNPLKIHNLHDITFQHKKIVCREAELLSIRDLLFGKDLGYRKSGSLVIYGYGGVGKTALVLEFIYRTIKDIYDNLISERFDFVLFFTSKDEVLTYSQTTGNVYVNEIVRQINTFDDFKTNLFRYLNISNVSDLNKFKGIVVIDNIENISNEEKSKFFDFIKQSPRSIQYIITSRVEEPAEDKIHLKEFKELAKGIEFIDTYILENNLSIVLTTNQKSDLVNNAKGNTLILVLSLQSLEDGKISFDEIITNLRAISTGSLEIIADFMYKNTLTQAIDELLNDNYKPIEILKIISLYEVPIDLYSISSLTGYVIGKVEYVCNYLTTRLILDKKGESFVLNEFANKFVFIKYLPDRIEKSDIKSKIREYQEKLNNQLDKLERLKVKEPLLNNIMEDWKPLNSIDKIAISDTFSLFGKAKDAVDSRNYKIIDQIRQDILRNEKMSSHPYIKVQKARIHELLLTIYRKKQDHDKLLEIMKCSYEEVIESIDFYYTYIKGTRSHGSILWKYGLFLLTNQQYKNCIRYIEDGVEIFDKLNIKDKLYYTMVNNLCRAYYKVYQINKNTRYILQLKKMYESVVENRANVEKLGFNVTEFIKNYKTIIEIK